MKKNRDESNVDKEIKKKRIKTRVEGEQMPQEDQKMYGELRV